MSYIRIVGEDALCCALGERLVAQVLPEWQLSGQSINTQGISKLVPNLVRYAQQARHVQPVLCIADTDHRCPVDLLSAWMPHGASDRLLVRLAVSEAESWVLADREGAAEFFGIATKHVPVQPESEPDAKRTVLRLARLSSSRQLRQEMISPLNIDRPGSGYVIHLRNLVMGSWRPDRAAQRSESLLRAMHRIGALSE